MTTERQSESARITGAKSHGPISAEGKEKSSRNSLRHGCTASHTLLLACEDSGDLDRMLEKYNAMYKPTTLEEQDLVAEMCSARWRIRRATGIETALIDCEMVTEEPKLKQKFATVDTGMVLSAAFRSLADESHSMDLLTRYESRLRRIHKQAHAMLLRLRQERQSEPAPSEPPPQEPPPAPTQSPALDPNPQGGAGNPAGRPVFERACLQHAEQSTQVVDSPPRPADPPSAIPLTPKPETRCSARKTGFRNEPAVQRSLRRFRTRRERKIFNSAGPQACKC